VKTPSAEIHRLADFFFCCPAIPLYYVIHAKGGVIRLAHHEDQFYFLLEE
jgi:hypothetical protein